MNAREKKENQQREELFSTLDDLKEFMKNNPGDEDLVLDGIRDGLRELSHEDFFSPDPSWLMGED